MTETNLKRNVIKIYHFNKKRKNNNKTIEGLYGH